MLDAKHKNTRQKADGSILGRPSSPNDESNGLGDDLHHERRDQGGMKIDDGSMADMCGLGGNRRRLQGAGCDDRRYQEVAEDHSGIDIMKDDERPHGGLVRHTCELIQEQRCSQNSPRTQVDQWMYESLNLDSVPRFNYAQRDKK